MPKLRWTSLVDGMDTHREVERESRTGSGSSTGTWLQHTNKSRRGTAKDHPAETINVLLKILHNMTTLDTPSHTSPSQPIVEENSVKKKGWELEDTNRIRFSWENIVLLRGRRLKQAKSYLFERDGDQCAFCESPVNGPPEFHGTDVDHIDEVRRNNRRWNLRLAHHDCNAIISQRNRNAHALSMLSEGEREKSMRAAELNRTPRAFRGGVGTEKISDTYPGWGSEWSNREGEKSDVMHARYDAWINDMERGPFRDVGALIRLQDLADMAPRMLGIGRSQTYRKYIKEDRFGPLEVFRDYEAGGLWVRYKGAGKIIQKLDSSEK